MGCAGPECTGAATCCAWTSALVLVKIQRSAAESASTVRTRRKFPPKNAEQERTRCKVLNHNTEAESLNCLSGYNTPTAHAMTLKAKGLHRGKSNEIQSRAMCVLVRPTPSIA